MADLDEMEEQFFDQISLLKSKKGKNNQLFTREEYYTFLSQVKKSKKKVTGKTPQDYQRLKRYDVIRIGSIEKLIHPATALNHPIMYYTFLEENFQIIHDIHIAIGHGGRNRMMKEVKANYKNITVEIVVNYLNLCKPCKNKMSLSKKGLLVNQLKKSNINSRCHVDIIDMQSQADGDYKFIMVYQHHLTKFIQLRALTTKRAEEVAFYIVDIFTIFGAPCILLCDNDREFTNRVIEEIYKLWNEIKIVTGKPKHSQSQSSVERSNQDIKNILSTWLETNNTPKWSEAIKFIQFIKNRAHHSEIDRSPYEAMFGCKAKVGLKTHLPADAIFSEITTEEELEQILNEECNDDIELKSTTPEEDEYIEIENNDNVEMKTYNSTEHLQLTTAGVLEDNVKHTPCIQKPRNSSKQTLYKQPNKMLPLSKVKDPNAGVGKNVFIRIPDVHCKVDNRNIVAVIMSVTNEELYQLGTKYGILNRLYARNQFTTCKEFFFTITEVPNHEITLRECARLNSNLNAQESQSCNCISVCNSNRCKCKKAKISCNFNCHKNSFCKNK